jgi:DNA (cytosine-5)-methyltransferase 1
MTKKIISLFSGALGLDLGLEDVGLKIAVAVDKNKTAVDTIKLNRQERLPIIDKSIEDVCAADILKKAGLKKKQAFLLTGGPCCQTFSTAGRRGSLSDAPRGLLFRDFKRIVAETQPRFFLMENVKGMLSAAVRHRPLNQRESGFPPLAKDEVFGSALEVICAELGALNYYIIFALVNCADYGVPQKRYRVLFIGSRDGEEIVIPPPTHSNGNGKIRWQTLRDCIGSLRQGPPRFAPFSKEQLRFLKLLKAGQNWHDLPARLQKEALGAAYVSWGGRSGFCRRLAWDKPAPTLTTDPGGRATMLCHPTKLRPLTVREYACLQQFPDDWKFAGSVAQRYIQIGNAVPIGLGRAIGKMLISVASRTDRGVLPRHWSWRRKVVCGDPVLAQRLKNRPKTKLNPPRMRKNKDPEAARQWLQQIAA